VVTLTKIDSALSQTTLYEELALYLRFTRTQVRTLPTRISSATSSREEIKSKRIKFTEQQRTALELEYRKEPYIGAIRKAELAEEFSVHQRALQAQGVTAYVPNHGWDIPAVPITPQVQRVGVSMTNGFTDNLGVRRIEPMNENHKYVLAYQPIICPTPPQCSREFTMNITNDSYPVNIGEKLSMNDQCSSSQGNIILKNK
ncbi:hypothetical protein GWI33_007285, partial [Rhynchophorus ferrugineus]